MSGSGTIDYARFMVEEIPEDIKKHQAHFSIEISIVMRKPKGHFSRAPGVVLDILSSFNGGTFFEGQGYWKGVQEPVVYILISTTGRTEDIINLLRSKIISAQSRLKQQEAFVKINGTTFVGNMLEKSVTDQFPKQWEFDTDMKTITANQSRSDEHYNLIYGRVDYQRQKYDDAQIKWTEMIREFAQKDTLSQNEKRDLLKCYSNILSPKLSLSDEEVEGICSQFNQLLPVNSESKFDEEILSLHAEGRMRGNRLKLYRARSIGLIKEMDLVEDGFFALNQILTHLEKGRSPYLDYDPITDMGTIVRHIRNLTASRDDEIIKMIQAAAKRFPEYKNDFDLIL